MQTPLPEQKLRFSHVERSGDWPESQASQHRSGGFKHCLHSPFAATRNFPSLQCGAYRISRQLHGDNCPPPFAGGRQHSPLVRTHCPSSLSRNELRNPPNGVHVACDDNHHHHYEHLIFFLPVDKVPSEGDDIPSDTHPSEAGAHAQSRRQRPLAVRHSIPCNIVLQWTALLIPSKCVLSIVQVAKPSEQVALSLTLSVSPVAMVTLLCSRFQVEECHYCQDEAQTEPLPLHCI